MFGVLSELVSPCPSPLFPPSSKDRRCTWGGGDGDSDLGEKEWRFCGEDLDASKAALMGEIEGWELEVVAVVVVVGVEVGADVELLLRLLPDDCPLWDWDAEVIFELTNVLAAWFS